MGTMKTVKTGELLGFKELEDRTRIPGSTIRRYAERFPRFLPGRTVDRVRRFPPEQVEVFRRIHELYQEGKRTEEVAAILALEVAATYDISTISTDATTIPTQAPGEVAAYLGPILDRLATALERIADNGARTAAAVEARLAHLEALSGHSDPVLGSVDTPGHAERKKPQEQPIRTSTMNREEIIKRVLELRAQGLGAGSIATALRHEGTPTLSGRGQWGKGSVRRILEKTYIAQSD